MKKAKKFLAILLALVFAFAMCACGDDADDDGQTGVANPIVETDQAGILEATGIEIAAPEGAEDVEYSYIKGTEDGQQPIAQVEFEFEDNDYCYRIQMTDQLSMYGGEPGEEANLEELMKTLNDGTNVGAQLSGMYYEWEASGTTVVDYCDGVFAFNQGDEGFISWLDVVPGALYCLSMEDDCTQDLLDQMAAKLFVPMQGDV